jgi:hypothetical protein
MATTAMRAPVSLRASSPLPDSGMC